MNEIIQSFLTFFMLDSLGAVPGDITVAQFLGLVIIAFFALIFTIISIRCIMEFIKILTDYRRYV